MLPHAKPATSLETRRAMMADSIAGMSQKEIAAKYDLHPVTVSKIITRANQTSIITIDALKEQLIRPSFRTLLKAINCHKSIYQAGSLAATTLKGLGIFAPDAPNLSLHFSQPPTTWSTAVSALTTASPAPQLPAPASEQASEASNS